VLTNGDVDARFLFEKANGLWKKGSKAEAIDRLKEAVAAAPAQTDVRLALAGRQLEAGSEVAAVDTLRASPPSVELQTYWAALGDPKVASLLPKVGLPQSTVVLGHDPPDRLFWSPERKWFAWVGVNGLEIHGLDGTLVFSDPIARPNDLDEDRNVVPKSAAAVQRRWGYAEKLLGAFSFVPFASMSKLDHNELSEDLSFSWLRWKALDLVVSAGKNIIRVRRAGTVIFEKKIEADGEIRVESADYAPQGPYLFVGWGRWSGPDECPVWAGIEIVHLPPAPAVPSKRP
jgi:hypothetical protein